MKHKAYLKSQRRLSYFSRRYIFQHPVFDYKVISKKYLYIISKKYLPIMSEKYVPIYHRKENKVLDKILGHSFENLQCHIF